MKPKTAASVSLATCTTSSCTRVRGARLIAGSSYRSTCPRGLRRWVCKPSHCTRDSTQKQGKSWVS